MSGFILLHRDLIGNPQFRGKDDEYAAIWLITNAAWEPTTARVAGKLISLDRGQCCFATSFLAQAWECSKATAHARLRHFEKNGFIRTEVRTGITVITVCKYADYQPSTNAPRTHVRTSPERSPNDVRTKKNEVNEVNEVNEDTAAAARADVNAVLDQSRLVGKTVLSLMGIDLTKLDAAHWLSKLDRAATWLADGFDPDLDIYPAVNAVLDRERLSKNDPSWVPASLRYFDRAIADRRVERSNKLSCRDAVPVGSHRPHPKSASAAFDRLDAELAARRAPE
ncbi:hypothetical protein A6A04_13380 [Paramagnetospirillum marisnigri]|uniref:Helix-turn-helix domain-containing protein n=1 Tax=Paramagnetospirillum marisnigri TaxID=1285242 RepID=A0A178MUR2_9PROT|nr:hypothetical protein [Paramagnetospirillum marisnigri]OAN53879.1 hypothetical protein A6A04_13380 [Paramagnetospirillum marisnigri]